MIISRTPYRISFFGGGTDYPAWYREHGGGVLACSINKYVWLSCRRQPPFFDYKYRIVWDRIENCTTIDEIVHPAVRNIVKYLQIEGGLEIHHQGDLPARSGMGSSSSFTVGLLNALSGLQGKMSSKFQLAIQGIRVEQEVMKENVGSQDQVTAAYGGLNHIRFLRNGNIFVNPVTISRDRLLELESHLMLFYTGVKRTASGIADSYTKNIEKNELKLKLLGGMAGEGLSFLNSNQFYPWFGRLLDQGWAIKRSLSDRVSSEYIDEIYGEAKAAGAIGGKLTGAGGGGFMLLFVPPDWQKAVRNRLSKLLYVPFKIEFTGSQIIFYEPDPDYSTEEKDRNGRLIEPFRESPLMD